MRLEAARAFVEETADRLDARPRRRRRAEHRGRHREVPRHRGRERRRRRRDPGARRLRLHPALPRGEDPPRRPDHDDLRGHLGDHGDDHRPGPVAGAPEVPRPLLPRLRGRDWRRCTPRNPRGRRRRRRRSASSPWPGSSRPAASAGSPATSTCCSGSASWSRTPRPPPLLRRASRPRRWPACASRSADPVRRRGPRRDSPGSSPARPRTRSPRTARAGSPARRTRSPVARLARRPPARRVRAAQAGLLADMDRVADVLYGRPLPDADRRRRPDRPTALEPQTHRFGHDHDAPRQPPRRRRRHVGDHARRPRRRRVLAEHPRTAGTRSRDVPPDRWDPALYYDPGPQRPGQDLQPIGGWVREFDWEPERLAAAGAPQGRRADGRGPAVGDLRRPGGAHRRRLAGLAGRPASGSP